MCGIVGTTLEMYVAVNCIPELVRLPALYVYIHLSLVTGSDFLDYLFSKLHCAHIYMYM